MYYAVWLLANMSIKLVFTLCKSIWYNTPHGANLISDVLNSVYIYVYACLFYVYKTTIQNRKIRGGLKYLEKEIPHNII